MHESASKLCKRLLNNFEMCQCVAVKRKFGRYDFRSLGFLRFFKIKDKIESTGMQIFQKLGFRQLLSFGRKLEFSKILIFLSCVYKLFSSRVLSNQIKDLWTNQIADISNNRLLGIRGCFRNC